ncbi:MAG: hypothetical protein K9H16_14465, partial [Bacteroidales bacterium]|nr:hypothetical protein [Bacteroidales bacterium]
MIPIFIFGSCNTENKKLLVDVFETSASGKKIEKISEFPSGEAPVLIRLFPDSTYQSITGFGGSFTESSAFLLNQLSKKNRELILNAYFGNEGAKYSLTRTHINSCDFSLGNYSYAPLPG